MKRDIIIQKIYRILEHCKEIEFADLYGSVARGKATHLSDIDAGIFCKKYNHALISVIEKLEGKLVHALEIDRIDITVMNLVDPLLLYEIFTRGKLIFARDMKIYYREKARSFSLYPDHKRLIDFYYNNIKEKKGLSKYG